MPLQQSLIGLMSSSAAYVVVKKDDASEFKHEHSAKEKNAQAKSTYEEAESNLKASRDRAQTEMNELGELRLRVWKEHLGRFAALFSRLKDVEYTGTPYSDELQEFNQTIPEMKSISLKLDEAFKGGAAALGAGAVVGVSSYLGVAALGTTASTSTAIGTLSGAAATNATLAWFGGGSLATGGAGVAGGMCVLGGIIALPVLVVGGVEVYAHEEMRLANSKTNLEQARIAAVQMNTAAMICDGIYKVACQFREAVEDMCDRLDIMLDGFEELLDFEEQLLDSHEGNELVSYKKLDPDVQQRIQMTVLAVQVMKILCETPILEEDGSLCKDTQSALDNAADFKQVAA